MNESFQAVFSNEPEQCIDGLVFSRFYDLHGNLGNVKQKPNHLSSYQPAILVYLLINTGQNSKDVGVSCPNIIIFYNNGMDGVDIMDQKTASFRLDHNSKYHFYLSIFFDLVDVTHVNSHIVYMKLGDNISILNFKIVIAKALISRYSNCNRSFSTTRRSKQKSHKPSMNKEEATQLNSSRGK